MQQGGGVEEGVGVEQFSGVGCESSAIPVSGFPLEQPGSPWTPFSTHSGADAKDSGKPYSKADLLISKFRSIQA